MGALSASGQGRSLRNTATYVLSVSIVAQCAAALVLLSTLIDPNAGPGLKAAVTLLAASRTVNVYLQERARQPGHPPLLGPNLGGAGARPHPRRPASQLVRLGPGLADPRLCGRADRRGVRDDTRSGLDRGGSSGRGD